MENDNKLIEAYEKVILNEARKNVIPLKSKITGTSDGKDLKEPYRAVMWFANGKWMFGIEQSFDGKFTKNSATSGGWALRDMIDGSDFIWIDAGQKWGAKGIKKAAEEALKNI